MELQVGLGCGQVPIRLHSLQFLGGDAIAVWHPADGLQPKQLTGSAPSQQTAISPPVKAEKGSASNQRNRAGPNQRKRVSGVSLQ